MSDDDGAGRTDDTAPRRFRTLRFNPLRRVLPWVALVVGVVQTVRAALGIIDPIFLIAGPILAVVGILAFFVSRWMAKWNL